MKLTVNIPPERVRGSQARLEAHARFEYVDQVPVIIGFDTRYPLAARGVGFRECFSDPVTQFHHQLENFKWIVEHVEDDRCSAFEVPVGPNFQNTKGAGGMGAEVDWNDETPPRTFPCLSTPEQAVAFEPPHPRTGGLAARRIEWFERMRELARDVEVSFGDEPGRIVAGGLGGSEGVFTCAVDLVGPDFYWWLREYPEACHRLLGTITDWLIEWERVGRELMGTETAGLGTADDAAQVLSPHDFHTFCVPYIRRLYEAFPGDRGMHMCGNSTHLHDALVNELGITDLNGFGREVDPAVAARNLGGRVRLRGNIDPMLIHSGPVEQIRASCRRALEHLAPYGGYVLQDGYNIPPGTPLEHIAVLREAAEEYGRPTVRPRSDLTRE